MEKVSISHIYNSLDLVITASAVSARTSIGLIIRVQLMLLPSSAIIEDIRTFHKSGLATLAFIYCEFRDDPTKERPACGRRWETRVSTRKNRFGAVSGGFRPSELLDNNFNYEHYHSMRNQGIVVPGPDTTAVICYAYFRSSTCRMATNRATRSHSFRRCSMESMRGRYS
jgi:hypothetical protein